MTTAARRSSPHLMAPSFSHCASPGYVTNLGDGPLDLRGNPQLADDADLTSHDVWQRALTIDGDWVNLTKPPIDFEVDDGHDHFHVMDIVEYSLWDTSGTVEISSGAKVGFCLIDIAERPDLYPNPGPQRYEQWDPGNNYCQSGRPGARILHMGISEGWQDIYGWDTTFQWIDVSDVRPGYYRIGQRADPDNFIVESDETNNALALSRLLHVVPGYVAKPQMVSVEPDTAVRFKLSVDEYLPDTISADESPAQACAPHRDAAFARESRSRPHRHCHPRRRHLSDVHRRVGHLHA